jgi:hypothetical protein
VWLGFSDQARTAVRSGRTQWPVFRVDILHGGWPVYQLDVLDGNVQREMDRAIQANLSATLVDPTGALTRGDVDDLLNPYDCEIAPHRGVRYRSVTYGAMFTPNAGFGVQPFGTSGFGGVNVSTISTSRWVQELAPLGVFGLTSREVSDGADGLTIRLTGQDRAMGYQVPMKSSLAIPGATSVEQAVVKLLSRVNPSLTLLAMTTGRTVGPLLYEPTIDVWEEAQSLATSVGARLYHDRAGQCVLMPAGPARYAVAAYGEGDGLLIDLDRTEDSDSIRNVVIAENTAGTVRALAYDDDPESPTYAGGRYGFRAFRIENEHLNSTQQAQQAAVAALVRELGRVETVGFSAVPDPGLDVGDTVLVNRPRAGLDRRALVVDTVDMPLSVDGAMRVGCRKSVLAQDGEVLPEEAA